MTSIGGGNEPGRETRPAHSLPGGVLILIALATAIGCSPVYTFRSSPTIRQGPDTAQLQARVTSLLRAQGFQSMGASERASGDIGCAQAAADRETFAKEWRDGGHRWVWVHTFSCDGTWHVAIVSSRDADSEAAELRDALSAQLSAEIASGTVRVDRSYRLALE